MEAFIIENDDTFITECSRYTEHEAHSWREGFMRLRKRTCKGLTKEQSDRIRFPKKPLHKHKLIIQNHLEFIDPLKLVWHCECGKFFSCTKRDFYWALSGMSIFPTLREPKNS